MIKVWAFRISSIVAPLIPRRLGLWGACVLGYLAFYLAPGARHIVESNMANVLGSGAAPPKVRWLARRVFCNAAKNYFDLFRLAKLDISQLGKLVQTDGFDHFANAIAEGKGVIVVTAHLGNFDVTGQEIAARALNLTILAEPLHPPELFDLIQDLRESNGVKWVPVGPSTLKEVVKVLRRGDAVGIACDRDIQKSGIKVPFFGRIASVPQGAAYLALRTGARIVPAFGERREDDTFAIHIEPAIEVVKTNDFESDVQATMRRVLEVIERQISARPDQWVVFERIWPDGAACKTDREGEAS